MTKWLLISVFLPIYAFTTPCDAIDALLQDRSTNLVRKEEALKAIQEEVLDAELERRLIPVIAELAGKAVELKAQKGWLELGFSEEFLSTDAAAIQFLMRSGFAYHMYFFSHEPVIINSEPHILMEGEYIPFSKLVGQFMLDWKTGSVVSRQNRDLFYNYISPDGIVQKSRTPTVFYPIAKVAAPETCLIQIITSTDKQFDSFWLTDNLNDLLPHHTSIRLIDKEGNLYSFGLEMTRELEQFVHNNEHSCFAQGHAKIVTPDFRDTRPYNERFITTLAIEDEALERALAFAGAINAQEAHEFSITGKNCNRFGTMLLEAAGISLDTRISVAAALIRSVPVIGRIVEPIFSELFLPNPVNTVATNSLLYLLGAHVEGQKLQKSPYTAVEDFFDDENAEIHHPYRLIDWQKQQETTVAYPATKHPRLEFR